MNCRLGLLGHAPAKPMGANVPGDQKINGIGSRTWHQVGSPEQSRIDGRWEWVPGHWIERPRRDAVWVVGRWDRRGPEYVWVDGHWR